MALQTVELETSGMHCQSCSMLIQMSVSELDGVSEVHADYATGITKVTFDPDTVQLDAIIAEIMKAGYEAAPKEA